MNPARCYVIAFGALVVATLVTSEPLHSRDVIDTPGEIDDVTSTETDSPDDVIPVTSHLDKRIVNGRNAQPGSHKYIVQLQWRDGGPYQHDCGGVLIDRGWVLTAAHCVDHHDLKDKEWYTKIRVVVGEHHLEVTSSHEQRIGVEDIRMHDGYNNKKLINDIALIKLKHNVTLTEFVELAILPSDDNPETKDCMTAGWGRDGDTIRTNILQEANVTVITNKKCKRRYFKNLTPGKVCTLDKPGKQPCKGDSGGPLVCGLRDKVLIGIVSYGKKGCNGKRPEVYTRVSKYLDFIKDEMK